MVAALSGPTRQAPRSPRRPGHAVVEFAAVAPFLFLLVVGMIELSRAIMVKEALTDASRRGANAAIKNGKTYADVSAAVDDILAKDKQLPATIANGKATLTVTIATWDAGSQTYGADTVVTSGTFAPNQYDKIGVKVAVHVEDVALLFLNFSASKIESETVYMMKQ
jgi:Flp pilus assembly protein TadG